jgi:hypothetical protein
MGYAGADGRGAAGTGVKGDRVQGNGLCFEALFPAWARGFPAGAAIGDAETADQWAEVAERRNERDFGRDDGEELKKGQGALAGVARQGLTARLLRLLCSRQKGK